LIPTVIAPDSLKFEKRCQPFVGKLTICQRSFELTLG
jgi:hypothetical protein